MRLLLGTVLVSTLLFTSGCDEIDPDTTPDDVYSSVVYVTDNIIEDGEIVNIDMSVDGNKEHIIANERPLPFTQTGTQKEIDLFYEKSDIDGTLGSETLDNSGSYIYATTECSFNREYLLDTVTDRSTIRFMNLTADDVSASELRIKRDGVLIPSLPDVTKCSVTTMPYLLSKNGTWIVEYAGVEIGRVHITNDAAIAIIIYDTIENIAKVIKVETYDELIPVCDAS